MRDEPEDLRLRLDDDEIPEQAPLGAAVAPGPGLSDIHGLDVLCELPLEEGGGVGAVGAEGREVGQGEHVGMRKGE